MDKSPHKKNVKISFQFVFIILTSIVVSICLYRSFSDFTSNETSATIKKLTPKILEKFGGHPGIVTVGLTINDFLTFDPVKDDFTFIGIVWFEFDPAIITLDQLGKFQFNRAEILSKSEPDARIVNNKFLVRYTVKVRFKNQLSYQFFPFDDHRLSLQLVNSYISTSEVIFESVASNFSIRAATDQLGWKRVDEQVETGFVETDIKDGGKNSNLYYPAVFFTIDYLRTGIRYAFTILLPLLAIFFISLFAFSLDPARYETLAISLSAGSVTALLAYRFVIENLSPAVGYFMLSDFIFFLFLALVSLIFIFSIVLKSLPLWAKQVLIVALHAIVCAAFLYLTFIWMR